MLNQARGFYLDFFLAHPEKLFERVPLVNKETGEVREAVISADKLLSLSQSIRRFPPQSTPILLLAGISARASLISPGSIAERRIKDCIGKARAYHTAHATWKQTGKAKGKPGLPTPANHPTLYSGVFSLQLNQAEIRRAL